MAHKHPVENVFGTAVVQFSVVEIKQWLASHSMIVSHQSLRVGGNKQLTERYARNFGNVQGRMSFL